MSRQNQDIDVNKSFLACRCEAEHGKTFQKNSFLNSEETPYTIPVYDVGENSSQNNRYVTKNVELCGLGGEENLKKYQGRIWTLMLLCCN